MNVSLLRTNEGITAVYKQYVKTVYRIALMMLKYRTEAEDATQTVFIKLMTTDKDFKSEEHLKAWLIVTTQNVCKNVLKSGWHSKQVDYESIAEQTYIPDGSAKEIWGKIISLDDKYKLPIYLHYYEGYKTEEISEMLKINHATVRTQLRTAREKLKQLLGEEASQYE